MRAISPPLLPYPVPIFDFRFFRLQRISLWLKIPKSKIGIPKSKIV